MAEETKEEELEIDEVTPDLEMKAKRPGFGALFDGKRDQSKGAVPTNFSEQAVHQRAKRKKKKALASKDLLTATLAEHTPLANAKTQAAKRHLPDAKDKRTAQLMEAYTLIVENGHSIGSAAKLLGMSNSTLVYHSKKNRWQEAKMRWQLLKENEKHADDVSLRAIATKEILLSKVQQASKNLQLLQRIAERKIVHAISNTQDETVYDAEGKQHKIPVPKITAKALNDLADLQMKLLEKMSVLADRSDAKILHELHKIRRNSTARKARLAKSNLEIGTKHAPNALEK